MKIRKSMTKLIAGALVIATLLSMGTFIASADSSDPVERFVTRLYENALEREPDSSGLNHWSNQLRTKASTGADVAYRFFFSTEMTNRNPSNEQYVELLYKTLMDRTSDSSGKTHWVGLLNAGTSREYVFAGFVNSPEFNNICTSYGIVRGSYTPIGQVVIPEPPRITYKFPSDETEEFYIAGSDTKLIGDRIVVHALEGYVYSTFDVYKYEAVMNYIEKLTGLGFGNEKIDVYEIDDSSAYFYGGPDDLYICVPAGNRYVADPQKQGESFKMQDVAHELSHALLYRNVLTPLMKKAASGRAIDEGFAQLIQELTYRNNVNKNNDPFSAARFSLNHPDNPYPDFIDRITYRLAVSLSYHDYLEKDLTYSIGYIFMQYIYQNFGMGGVIGSLKAINYDTDPADYLSVMSKYLGVDIEKELPKWCSSNLDKYIFVPEQYAKAA